MSTNPPPLSLESAFSDLPTSLRSKLVKSYSNIKSKMFEKQHDAIGHQAGKLAEILIRVVQHILTGKHIPLSTGLKNFKNLCDEVERMPQSCGPEGIRILMPRALLFMYTIRNKRDSGHVGGEVDANEIDSLTVQRLADWCMCELIRVSNNLPLEDAQILCDAVAERKVPSMWNVLGRKRILDTSLSYREQTLLLLYTEIDIGIPCEDLFEWTEHSNRSAYNRDVLKKLHSTRHIEWDKDLEMAVISPTGICEVEEGILPKLKSL